MSYRFWMWLSCGVNLHMLHHQQLHMFPFISQVLHYSIHWLWGLLVSTDQLINQGLWGTGVYGWVLFTMKDGALLPCGEINDETTAHGSTLCTCDDLYIHSLLLSAGTEEWMESIMWYECVNVCLIQPGAHWAGGMFQLDSLKMCSSRTNHNQRKTHNTPVCPAQVPC